MHHVLTCIPRSASRLAFASDVLHKVALQGCCISQDGGLDASVQGAFTALHRELVVRINTCCQLPNSLLDRRTSGDCDAFRAAARHLLPSLLLHFFSAFAFAFTFPFPWFAFVFSTAAGQLQRPNPTALSPLQRFESSLGTMSGCGYNDPEMMKAAIELAQSFSKAKGGGKSRAGGGGQGGRKEAFQPQPQRQQSRYSQVAATPRQASFPSVPESRSLAPPPSRRNYNAPGDFATGRAANRPVIGNLGRDFLVSSGVKPEPPSKLAPPSSHPGLFKAM